MNSSQLHYITILSMMSRGYALSNTTHATPLPKPPLAAKDAASLGRYSVHRFGPQLQEKLCHLFLWRYFLVAHNPTPPRPTAVPTPLAQTIHCKTSFCHRSLLNASPYPTSGRKVTISYRLVQPLTLAVGNGSVNDNVVVCCEGKSVERKESRVRRR